MRVDFFVIFHYAVTVLSINIESRQNLFKVIRPSVSRKNNDNSNSIYFGYQIVINKEKGYGQR